MNFCKCRRLNLFASNHHNYAPVYMSTCSKQKSHQDPESSKNLPWTTAEEKALLSGLLEGTKSGTGSHMELSSWEEVAFLIGKSVNACRTKWTRVSDSILTPSIFLMIGQFQVERHPRDCETTNKPIGHFMDT